MHFSMSGIIHPSEDFSFRIFQHNEAVISEYKDAVKCVYGAVDNKMRAAGSCVPIEVCGRRFLLTAAHVLDNLKHTDLMVGMNGFGFPVPRSGGITTAVTGNREEDIYDFGWVEISKEMQDKMKGTRFFNVKDLSFDEGLDNSYLAFGYPVSRNKPKLSLGEITPRPTHFVTEGCRRDGELIYIIYPERGYFPDLDLVKVTGDPVGLSGGALINMGLRRSLGNVLDVSEAPGFLGKLAGLITAKVVKKESDTSTTEIRCTDIRFIFREIERFLS